MLWNSDYKQGFRAALLDAYRDRPKLKIFVADALDKNLAEIAGGDLGLEMVVYELMDWADSNKRLTDLYRYFCDENPDHEFAQGVSGNRPETESPRRLGPTNLGKYRRAIPKFVGRDRAMDQLSELLADNEMVAIAASLPKTGLTN